jgi:hypothetical protein
VQRIKLTNKNRTLKAIFVNSNFGSKITNIIHIGMTIKEEIYRLIFTLFIKNLKTEGYNCLNKRILFLSNPMECINSLNTIKPGRIYMNKSLGVFTILLLKYEEKLPIKIIKNKNFSRK